MAIVIVAEDEEAVVVEIAEELFIADDDADVEADDVNQLSKLPSFLELTGAADWWRWPDDESLLFDDKPRKSFSGEEAEMSRRFCDTPPALNSKSTVADDFFVCVYHIFHVFIFVSVF